MPRYNAKIRVISDIEVSVYAENQAEAQTYIRQGHFDQESMSSNTKVVGFIEFPEKKEERR
jgi:hypothetical protein